MVRSMRLSVNGLALGLLCAVVTTGWGNGFRNPPEGAASMGRTGGKIVHVDDPSAVAQNPANLAEFKELRTYSSYTLVYPEVEFEGGDGRRDATTKKDKHIPSFFAAIPLKTEHPLVFGFSMSSPWGQSTVWPEDGALRGAVPFRAELMTLNMQPTLATRLGDRLLVAAGVDVMYSELSFRQWLPFGARVGLDGDGVGIGANAAVTLILTEAQRLALTYRSPMKVDYSGDTKVDGVTGPLAPASGFDSEIDFPSMAVLGYGVSFCEKWRLGLDVEWIEFSRFDALPLELGVNSGAGIFPPEIPQNWNDVWTYGLGLDYRVNTAWILRAGWVYLETPIPSDTMAPTLTDDDRHVVSVGAGYRMKNGDAIDVAYAYSEYDRTVSGNGIPAYDGNYQAQIHLFQVSYNYLF